MELGFPHPVSQLHTSTALRAALDSEVQLSAWAPKIVTAICTLLNMVQPDIQDQLGDSLGARWPKGTLKTEVTFPGFSFSSDLTECVSVWGPPAPLPDVALGVAGVPGRSQTGTACGPDCRERYKALAGVSPALCSALLPILQECDLAGSTPR